MIEIKNITKKYGNRTAVDGLSAVIGDDCIYGLLGNNGAGKTTTLNIITGCLAANEGTVIINGHDIYSDPIEAKRCIGYLPEQPPLYTDMTVREFLMFVGRARGIAKAGLEKQVDRAMHDTDILDVADRLIKQLSKGYRQRVGVAQAILGDPEIIILDEPTVGLDPTQVAEMRELIKSLAQSHTVIFSSHILSEVALLCDKVLILSEGKLIAEDTPKNLGYLGEARRLTVTAKGSGDILRSALDGIEGLLSFDMAKAKENGCMDIKISFENGKDIREAVSQRFMAAGCAILSMQEETPDFEDAFIRITGKKEEDEA